MAGIDRWRSCKDGFSTSAHDESDGELNELGIRNRLCEHPKVVASGQYPIVQFYEGGMFKDAAELHYPDSDKSPATQRALDRSCSNCQYYNK